MNICVVVTKMLPCDYVTRVLLLNCEINIIPDDIFVLMRGYFLLDCELISAWNGHSYIQVCICMCVKAHVNNLLTAS